MAGVAEPVTGWSDTEIGAEGSVGNSVGMAVTSWQHMIQCMLLVPSNTIARFTFMTGNRRVSTKQIVVPVPKILE